MTKTKTTLNIDEHLWRAFKAKCDLDGEKLSAAVTRLITREMGELLENEHILGLKILDDDMRSCNGGEMQWQLNKWYSVKGKIVICENGLHLTYRPGMWKGSRVFICETTKIYEEQGDKAVCRRMRLLMELSPEQLKAYGEAEETARKAYKEAEETAWKAYKEAAETALKAYEEAVQKWLRSILEKWLRSILENDTSEQI